VRRAAPRRTIVAFAIGAALGGVAVLAGAVEGIDLRTLDRLQRAARPAEASQVVLVDLDERTVLAFGWPIDPTLHAAVAEALHAAGARAIGLDVVLSDRAFDLEGRGAADASPADGLLGEVASAAGLHLAVGVLRRDVAPEAGRTLPATPASARLDCPADPLAFVAPLRAGLEKAPVGHVNAVRSEIDGVYRAVVPCVAVHDGCVRDLASAMTGHRAEAPRCLGAELVPFPRAFTDFQRISLYDLVAMTGETAGRERLRELVADRYVLIGASDPGIADLGRTPAALREPLVTVHANRVDALLTGRRITSASGAALAVLCALALLGLFWLRLSARAWLGVAALALVVAAGASFASFRLFSFWLPPGPWSLPVALAAAGAAAHQGWRHLRFNQILTQAFGRYVSPDVLSWLQRTGGAALDPSAAERREVAVLFSDVAGYTRLSNRLPPEKVLASLRLYLEAMVAIVQRHGGYLDKINGDGLMVLFGAPASMGAPSESAVACAEEMLAEVSRIQDRWRAMTGGDLAIRIGVATGPAFVGNLGGEGHVEYTAIGQVVNLAARLEPQAPVGGLLLCEATHGALPEPPTGAWIEVALKGYEAAGALRAYAVAPGEPRSD
jgi:class 3 adenylate cyclase/CHASE2 domain-containing sensor protein